MNDKEFTAELNRYRVVRPSNWKRNWDQPNAASTHVVTPTAGNGVSVGMEKEPALSPQPLASASSAAASAVPARAAAAAVVAPAPVTAAVAAVPEFNSALLRQFLSAHYDSATCARISDEFATRHRAFMSSLSLDDIEALAPVFTPNSGTALPQPPLPLPLSGK